MLSIGLDDLRLFLHVLAAAIWVGGQLVLAGLLPVLRQAGPEVPKAAAQAFGRIAWAAFYVLIATGIWNIVALDDELDDSADLRHTLIIKLVFVVLSGVAAFAHSRAKSRRGLAIWGAGTGLFALAALLFGVVLAGG